MSKEKLRRYAFRPVGTARIKGDDFVIEIIDLDVVSKPLCVYAFVVHDEVVRVGSTQNPLRQRMRQWERDVSRALKGLKSSTRPQESAIWREILKNDKYAHIFARLGVIVQTGVGPLNAFRLEEEALIAEFQPRLCWDRARFRAGQRPI